MDKIIEKNQTSKSVIIKYARCGFGKIKTEVEYCSLVNPQINGLGMNALFEQAGYKSRWVEHRVFVDGKPFFRYKGEKKHKIKVRRFLGFCRIRIY